jgi:prepilin-type processing-associated H-X9-DG protein
MSKQSLTRGFTFAELFIAIALSFMLIAILLPSITQSKENAKQSMCTQHLHQLGLETHTLIDNRLGGKFPHLNLSMAENEDNTINVLTTRRNWYSGGWEVYTENSFNCPSDTNRNLVQIKNSDDSTYYMPVSYGYHARMLYNGISFWSEKLGPPNEIAVFFDGYLSGPNDGTVNVEGNYLSTMDFALTSVQYRHRNRYAQAVFADWHVGKLDFFDTYRHLAFTGGNSPPISFVSNENNFTIHNNNGHGNNIDGVDSSNPGRGIGGPGGGIDPSGSIDDESRHGSSNGTH